MYETRKDAAAPWRKRGSGEVAGLVETNSAQTVPITNTRLPMTWRGTRGALPPERQLVPCVLMFWGPGVNVFALRCRAYCIEAKDEKTREREDELDCQEFMPQEDM